MLEPEDAVAEDDEADSTAADADPVEPTPPRARKARGGSATALGAAMLALGEIFEPEKTTVEIVQTDDDPVDDPPFDLDFGDLPPLD
jgi:hypothetical protein